MKAYQKHIFFCTNLRDMGENCCALRGGRILAEYAKARAKALGFKDQNIRVNLAGCLGQCARGPAVVVYPEGIWYTCKTEQDVDVILQHVAAGSIATNLLMEEEI